MTVQRGFIITVISGVVFALIGAGMGYVFGSVAPEYYRRLFNIHPFADFKAEMYAMGLGSVQGGGAGLIVGLVIVLAVAWHSSRMMLVKRQSEKGC